MSPDRRIHLRDQLVIALLGMLAYLPFLGVTPLFDWDEVNFAESAREMIASGNYFQVQINFEPFWEKPPLFFWMQVLCMKVFGIGTFAARLPNALVGILTLVSLYRFGIGQKGRRFAWLLTGFYLISLLPTVYFKSGIIDPTFNFFIFLGLSQVIVFEQCRQAGIPFAWRNVVMAGIWIGLATLTKGPVALLVAGLSYLIFGIAVLRGRLAWKALAAFLGVWAMVILAWFGAIMVLTPDGKELITKFIVYQVELFTKPVAGHQQPFFYHPVVFLLGCFPLSAFAIRGMFHRSDGGDGRILKTLMLVWFWVIMVLFSIAKTKIVHYSSMLYFPGAVLAALHAEDILLGKRRITADMVVLLVLGILLFGGLATAVNLVASNMDWISARMKDPFARANAMASVAWNGWEWLPGGIFLVSSILGLWMLRRGEMARWMVIQGLGTVVLVNGASALIGPRVADYTQGAATRFFEAHAHEDAYLTVSGYKSYAPYWYGKTKPFPHPEIKPVDREGYFKYGPIDKPVYLATKLTTYQRPDWQQAYQEFEVIHEEAGFVFLLRKP